MNDLVLFQNGILTIFYPKYGTKDRNYDSLFDFLGDYDIITASEIGKDTIVMSESVFLFTNDDEQTLKNDGYVSLTLISDLKSYIDKDNENHINFLNWYYNK